MVCKFPVSKNIDAVLPLILDNIEQFLILKESIELFFVDLGKLWIVCKDSEHNSLRSILENHTAFQIELIKESELIPQLRNNSKICDGWFVQQLVKISIANRIKCDFYLTLDADVICTKRFNYGDVIKDGRAITNEVFSDWSPEWSDWAIKVLNMPDTGRRFGVTPVLLHTASVIKLQEYLSRKGSSQIVKLYKKITYSSFKNSSIWINYLLRNIPWTEYRLYYTFVQQKNYFNSYHMPGALADLTNSVWFKEHFSSWDVKKAFEEGEGFFCVVQSKREIDANDIRSKIKKYFLKPESNETVN